MDQPVMTSVEVTRLRLHHQHISRTVDSRPEEVVRWLVAVQAQDYAGAKWALGLRLQDAVDSDIDQAFMEGTILRTHVLRPTWHFVTPADIRWLLALTAPRVHALNAYMYRQQGLDAETLKKSSVVLAHALRGNHYLTRDELRDVLEKAGIAADTGLRMIYMLMNAELEGLICSGPRKGKQFTYALLEERAPQAKMMEREEGLVELARRYFASRGPVTAQDFAKWSGLTLTDARNGLEAIRPQLQMAVVNGKEVWSSAFSGDENSDAPRAYLLSIYDEYMSSYKDYDDIRDVAVAERLSALGNDLTYVVVVNGRIVGTFKRTLKRDTVTVSLNIFTHLTPEENQAVAQAADRYGAFLQKSVILE